MLIQLNVCTSMNKQIPGRGRILWPHWLLANFCPILTKTRKFPGKMPFFLQEISWYLISCFLFSCQEMCHSTTYYCSNHTFSPFILWALLVFGDVGFGASSFPVSTTSNLQGDSQKIAILRDGLWIVGISITFDWA